MLVDQTATAPDVELRNLLVLAPLSALIGFPVFADFGFYRKHASSTSVPDLLMIAKGVGLATVLLYVCAGQVGLISGVPTSAHVLQFLVAISASAGLRLTARHWEVARRSRLKKRAGPRSPVLPVGTSPNADLFVRSLRTPGAKFTLMGIIDDVRDTRRLFSTMSRSLARCWSQTG